MSRYTSTESVGAVCGSVFVGGDQPNTQPDLRFQGSTGRGLTFQSVLTAGMVTGDCQARGPALDLRQTATRGLLVDLLAAAFAFEDPLQQPSCGFDTDSLAEFPQRTQVHLRLIESAADVQSDDFPLE